jgi:5-dehydro-4-deoxyglucarate dehydratase
MSRMTPKEMALTIGNGLLSFPVTPFDASNKFDAARYRSNLDWLCKL